MPYADPHSPAAKASNKRRHAKYYKAHYKDRISVHKAEKLRNDPVYRQKRRDYRRSWGQQRREGLIASLGGPVCIKCGFDDIRALCLDHINGDGREDIKKFGDNARMYNYYLKHPEEANGHLQVLCENCNRIKQRTNNEWGRHK